MDQVKTIVSLMKANKGGDSVVVPDWANSVIVTSIDFTSGIHKVLPNSAESLCNITAAVKLEHEEKCITTMRFTVSPRFYRIAGNQERIILSDIIKNRHISQIYIVEIRRVNGKVKETTILQDIRHNEVPIVRPK
jgi:hypothetical protein